MGNDAACQIVGIGSVQIRIHDNLVRTLTDVHHVPQLKKNLISLGVLDFKGCQINATGGILTVMKGDATVLKEVRQKSLYVLQGKIVSGVAAVASSSESDKSRLWHMRLGHMSQNGMNILSKRGLLGEKKISEINFCKHCVFGKQRRS